MPSSTLIRRQPPARGLATSPGTPEAAASARTWRASSGLVVLAFAALLVLFVVVALVKDGGGSPVGDESSYLRFADNLIHGGYADRGSDDPVHYLWHGPGLPLLLAPLVAIDAPLWLIRMTAPLFLFGAAVLLYRWLRLYARPRTALVAALSLGVYFPFWTILGYAGPDTLAVLLVVAALYAATLFLQSGRRRDGALAALALAFLAVTRVEYGWIAIACLVASVAWWALRRTAAPRRMAAVSALALALCLPWLAYTYSVADRVLYWGNSGGLSLYWMAPHREQDLGEWHSPAEVRTDPRLASHRAEFARIERLAPLERDVEYQRLAVRAIRDNPKRYARNVVANASRMVFFVPVSFGRQDLSLSYYMFVNAFLLALACGAVLVAARVRRALPTEVWLVIGFAALAFGIHTLVASYARLAMPLVPLVVWLGVVVVLGHVRIAGRLSGTGAVR